MTQPNAIKEKRRLSKIPCLKFSLKQLFLLVLVVAIGLTGWRWLSREIAMDRMERAGWKIEKHKNRGWSAGPNAESQPEIVPLYAILKMRDLQSLDLTGTRCSPDDLAELRRLPNLRSLSLRSCHLSAEHFEALSRMLELEELELSGNPINEEAMRAVANLPDLRRLDLSQAAVEPAAYDDLARCPSLEILDLSGDPLEARFLAHLRDLPRLRSLTLIGTFIPAGSLDHIAAIPALKELDLRGSYVMFPQEVEAFRRARPDVEIIWQGNSGSGW